MWQFTFLFRISACQYLGRAFCMEMNFNLHYNIQETSFEYKRRDQELAIQTEKKYKNIIRSEHSSSKSHSNLSTTLQL
jgi:hypothetical protein